jgi:predicted metalloprotease with PDZ domain
MIETTIDIDFDSAFKSMGLELRWMEFPNPWIGADWEFIGDRALVKGVLLDSPAHKAGLNAGDEIIFLNGLRFMREDAEKFNTLVMIDQPYEMIVSRLNKLQRVEITPGKAPRSLKEIAIIDREKAQKSFAL